jgi:hypothetical protein
MGSGVISPPIVNISDEGEWSHLCAAHCQE